MVSFGNFDSMTMSKHRRILSSQLQEYLEDNLSVFVEYHDPEEEKTIKCLFWNKYLCLTVCEMIGAIPRIRE